MRPSAWQAAHIYIRGMRPINLVWACVSSGLAFEVYMGFIMYAVLIITCNYGDKIKKNELGGNVARQRELKNAYRIFVGKPVGMRPFGRLRLKVRG